MFFADLPIDRLNVNFFDQQAIFMRDNLYTVIFFNLEKFQKRFFKKNASAVSDFLKFLNHSEREFVLTKYLH